MAEQPLNSMWLAARPTLISGRIFKQKQKWSVSKTQNGSFIHQAQQRFYACSASVASRASGAASHTAASVAAVASHQWPRRFSCSTVGTENNRWESLLKTSSDRY
jgi:hypothetical protein